MKYTCKFTVGHSINLYRALLPDVSWNKRASLTLEQKNDKLIINICALDPIALKAFVNSVIKLLEIDNKIDKV